MTRKREFFDRQGSSGRRSERDVNRDLIGERNRGIARLMSVDDRGVSMVMLSRNAEDNYQYNDDEGFLTRDNDTISKFQWKSLMEKSMPVERGEIRSLPTNNAAADEYRGRARNVAGRSVEDSDRRGRIRNVSNPLTEDGEYRRHTRNVTGSRIESDGYNGYNRNVTGLWIEDDGYNGHTRNMTGIRIEDTDYNRHARNLTGAPVEGVEFNGYARKETGLPVEDADYHGRPRTVMTSRPVEDGERMLVRDYPHRMDRDIPMKSYQEENSNRYRNGDSSRSLTPRSHSSGQRTPLDPYQGIRSSNLEVPHQGAFHHPADGIGISRDIPSSSCYTSHGIVYSQGGTNSCRISKKGNTFIRPEHNSNMDRHVEYIHSENQVSGKVYRRVLSEDTHGKYQNVRDCYEHVDTYGNDTSDPALPRHDCVSDSFTCSRVEDVLHNSDHTLQEARIAGIDALNRTAHEIALSGVDLESVDGHLEHQTQPTYETTPHEYEYLYEIGAHDVLYEDQIGNRRISREGTLVVDDDARQIRRSGDIDVHDQLKRMPKRKRGSAAKMTGPKHRTSTLGGSSALSYDDRLLEDKYVLSNRSSSHHFHSNETARMSKTESRLPFRGLSKELQSRLSKPNEYGSNDVKRRLKNPRFTPRLYGPHASKFSRGNVNSCVKSSLNPNHIDPQPYGKAKCTSAKKRLKPAPLMDVCPSDPQVLHPELDLESQQKLAVINSGCTKESGLRQEADPDHSIFKVKPSEKDPPENSEELKRQADHWFLKCMLYLNTNPGRQKKLKEQGRAGILKCIICSSSKEFLETKDVATHSFASPKVGFRAAHLGFHRALCVLMGWNPAVASNGRWVCKSLPDAEAWASKEDIIMWPPVVIIHNGSARDFYNNEQVKISIEQLENILRDMGLSEGKTTVCHGKPGNPNIMLVKFNGTLSGLQEAERLHNVFSEKKRGRTELKEIDAVVGCSEVVAKKPEDKIEEPVIECNKGVAQIPEDKIEDAGVGCNKEVAQKPEGKVEDAGVGCIEGVAQKPKDKIEDALYGYLGIVEDFDKLDYDMRRHCAAKSKKELLA